MSVTRRSALGLFSLAAVTIAGASPSFADSGPIVIRRPRKRRVFDGPSITGGVALNNETGIAYLDADGSNDPISAAGGHGPGVSAYWQLRHADGSYAYNEREEGLVTQFNVGTSLHERKLVFRVTVTNRRNDISDDMEFEITQPGAIDWKYRSTTGFLGAPVTGVNATPNGVGAYQHYQGGSIYWSPASGAHEVHGAIREAWARAGWENGLGFPLTDELITPDGIGRYTHFEGGSIYWTPATGAHVVRDQVYDFWARSGWEGGPYGYPVSDYAIFGGEGSQDFVKNGVTWVLRHDFYTDTTYAVAAD